METSKAIKLIENYITHHILIDNLWDIGFSPEHWMLDKTGLCTIIFDIDENRKDIDDVLESFCSHTKKLMSKINFHHKIPEELLTSTAIDIYSDWKAYSQKHQIYA